MTFVTKLNFWRRKRPFARSACSQRSLRGHQYELLPVNAMFLNCLCLSIFLENSRVYFPVYSRTAYNGLLLGTNDTCFHFSRRRSDSARHYRKILRDQCVFPKDQNKNINNSVFFVLSASKFKISSDMQV